MVLYLVGINHEASRYKQARGFTNDNLTFIKAIELATSKHPIDLLAEEEHPEYLIKHCATSLLDAIHRANGIHHVFIDPNSREREIIGYRDDCNIWGLEEFRTQVSYPLLEQAESCGCEIAKIAKAHEIAHHFPSRETFWLDELKKANARNVLFVCGDIHLRTFPKILAAEEIESEVIMEGIGVDYNSLAYEAFKFAEGNNMFSQVHCFCRDGAVGSNRRL